MFDAGGRFAQIIIGAELRVFGAKTFFAFGTYSVDEANKTFITRIDGVFDRQAQRHHSEP